MEVLIVVLVFIVVVASVCGIYFSRKRIASHLQEQEQQREEVNDLKRRADEVQRRQEEIENNRGNGRGDSTGEKPGPR